MQPLEQYNIFLMYYKNEVINALDILAPLYHTGFGFNTNINDKYDVRNPTFDLIKFINEKNTYFGNIEVLDGESAQNLLENDTIFNGWQETKGCCILFNMRAHFLELSQKKIIFEEVIIIHNKYNCSKYCLLCRELKGFISNQEYLKEWYNNDSVFWTKDIIDDSQAGPLLPFLKTRKYIDVVAPFSRIRISKAKKGSDLTIDDILFATRCIWTDDKQWLHSYKCMDVSVVDGVHILWLIPNFDY